VALERATRRRSSPRRGWQVGAAILLLALAACAEKRPALRSTAPVPSLPTLTLVGATIVEVLDADSIEMRLEDGRELHIQSLGIDAPDAGKPLRGGANDFARAKLTKGRRVYLEQGPQLWDDRGRYLALVWLSRPKTGRAGETSTRMFNAMMLVAGYAEVEPDDRNPKYATLFSALQRDAQRARRGIWD
jgi:micrococcal nuclease